MAIANGFSVSWHYRLAFTSVLRNHQKFTEPLGHLGEWPTPNKSTVECADYDPETLTAPSLRRGPQRSSCPRIVFVYWISPIRHIKKATEQVLVSRLLLDDANRNLDLRAVVEIPSERLLPINAPGFSDRFEQIPIARPRSGFCTFENEKLQVSSQAIRQNNARDSGRSP